MGLNAEFKGIVESMCPGGLLGLLSRTQDEVWDFFETLAWDNYAFEQAIPNLQYSTHDESVFPVHHYPRAHSIDFYDPLSYLCASCLVRLL